MLPQAVLLVEESNAIRSANRTWRDQYSHLEQSSLGRDFTRYVHPKDRPRIHDALERIWETGATANCMIRIVDATSSERWSDVYLRYHNAGGKPLIVLTISDINERVGEERLLLAQHRSINGILNDLPGMVYRCRNNPEWPMEYVSEGCVELTGYQVEDIVNSRKLSYGRMIIGEDKEPVWQEVQNALREHRRFELIYRIRTAGGEIKWVWEKGKGIYSADGELSGIEGFITDFGRQMASSRPEHSGRERGYTSSKARFMSSLHKSLKQLGESPDLRLVLFCIHLDRYERYLAGAGHEKLLKGLRHVGKTLRSIAGTADVLYASQPGRWFLLQLRRAGEVDVQRSADAITDAFLSPIPLGRQRIYVGTSIGCAIAGESGARNAARIIRHASRAMNTCHAAGSGEAEIVHL